VTFEMMWQVKVREYSGRRRVHLQLAGAASGGLGGDPDLVGRHVPHLLREQSWRRETATQSEHVCVSPHFERLNRRRDEAMHWRAKSVHQTRGFNIA